MRRRPAASLIPLGGKPRSPGAAATGPAGRLPGAGMSGRGLPVVIVDPQTLFRRGLALLIRQWHADAAVFDAGGIDQALVDMAIRPKPALLLLDAGLASRWNFAGLAQLVSRLPATPIVLLANEFDANTAASALEMGARSYIPKSISEAALFHALASAVSGEDYSPTRSQNVAREFTAALPANAVPHAGGPLRKLTYRQREVLSHLAHGRSNKEIARRLGLLESTVKVHVKTILKKLDATNRTQAAMLAIEMGWGGRPDA